MEAIFNHGHVDIDDITLFQHFFIAWDAVADHFIYRDADRFRETVIPQAGRNSLLVVGDMIVTDTIQFTRCYPGFT